MPKTNSRFQLPQYLFLITALPILLGACNSTHLTSRAITKKIFSLAAVNEVPLGYSVKAADKSMLAGHQYLFFALPLGSVYVDLPEQQIERAVYQSLTLSGYKPIAATSNAYKKKNIPKLFFTIKNLQVSAYDLFALRRIVCRLTLSTRFVSPDGLVHRIAEETSEVIAIKRFAFKNELEHYWGKALFEAVQKSLYSLRISKLKT